jgi:hypothetical protein
LAAVAAPRVAGHGERRMLRLPVIAPVGTPGLA